MIFEKIAAVCRWLWAPCARIFQMIFGKVRQPIGWGSRLLLGLLSIFVLIGAYARLSQQRHLANPKDTTIPNASQFSEGWARMMPKRPPPERSWPFQWDTSKRLWGDFPRFGFLRLSEGWKNYIEGCWLFSDFLATFGRLLTGILVGVLLSLIVGMAMGCLPRVEAFFVPPLSFLAKIPPTAMLAVYFVVFGTEYQLFVAMIALGIFPTLAQGIYQAAKKDVTDHAINKSLTLGASQMEVIWNVVFQQVLPRILENIRLQIGPAMVFLIAAEWIVADVGFGYRLRMQSRLLNMNVVYIYLIVLGVSGFCLDWLLSFSRRRLAPWFGE